jgi:hypothetical protein
MFGAAVLMQAGLWGVWAGLQAGVGEATIRRNPLLAGWVFEKRRAGVSAICNRKGS